MTRTNYLCTKCKYKFSRKDDTKFQHCPYCGGKGTFTIDQENTASKLLEEV